MASTSELLRDLGHGFFTLVRGEIELARAELTQNARDAGRNSARIALLLGPLFFGAQALLAFFIIGLGLWLGERYWLSALIAGVVLTVPAIFLIQNSLRSIQDDVSLETTRQSWEQDQEFLKRKIHPLNSRKGPHL